MAQNSLHPVKQTGSEKANNLASGTLNVILANRNGFVIATDSRRTFQDGRHSDDSQKLFRTGPRSALAIAGFASYLGGTLFDFEVAAVIRGRYGDQGIQSELGSPGMVSSWLSLLELELTKLAAILSTYRYTDFGFVATAVGFDGNSVPEIRRTDFIPTRQRLGFNGELFPLFAVRERPVKKGEAFTYEAVGIDDIARRILEGRYQTENRVVKSYARLRRRGRLNTISVEEMKALGVAIFEETINHSAGTMYVGGDLQIGVFPVNGNAQWIQQQFLPRHAVLLRSALTMGALISEEDPFGIKTRRFFAMADDFNQPLPVPFSHVFVGNHFPRAPVALDGNHYYGNTFEDCIFRYRTGPVSFANNRITRCILELPEGSIPGQLHQLAQQCTVVRSSVTP